MVVLPKIQQVTWEVAERNGGSELTITEHNLRSDEAKDASDQAWSMVLRNLKEMPDG